MTMLNLKLISKLRRVRRLQRASEVKEGLELPSIAFLGLLRPSFKLISFNMQKSIKELKLPTPQDMRARLKTLDINNKETVAAFAKDIRLLGRPIAQAFLEFWISNNNLEKIKDLLASSNIKKRSSKKAKKPKQATKARGGTSKKRGSTSIENLIKAFASTLKFEKQRKILDKFLENLDKNALKKLNLTEKDIKKLMEYWLSAKKLHTHEDARHYRLGHSDEFTLEDSGYTVKYTAIYCEEPGGYTENTLEIETPERTIKIMHFTDFFNGA